MAYSVDSKAAFLAKLHELDLGDLAAGMKNLGWDTYGDFAFCVNSAPGTDHAEFKKDVLEPLLQRLSCSLSVCVLVQPGTQHACSPRSHLFPGGVREQTFK